MAEQFDVKGPFLMKTAAGLMLLGNTFEPWEVFRVSRQNQIQEINDGEQLQPAGVPVYRVAVCIRISLLNANCPLISNSSLLSQPSLAAASEVWTSVERCQSI